MRGKQSQISLTHQMLGEPLFWLQHCWMMRWGNHFRGGFWSKQDEWNQL
jgi:hypothetical protein